MVDTLKNNLIELVDKSFNFKNCNSIEIGLSGGKDSVALLDVLFRLKDKYKFNLYAVHVNHNLSKDSNNWSSFCQDLCDYYQIKLRIEEIKIDISSKLGIEGEARKFRYQCFLKSNSQVLSLAHHMNDQIETYFLSVLRGGDLRGVVSMPVKRPLSEKILLWRPFLNVTRCDIESYNKYFNLKNIEDISNNNIYFLRNWVRQKLVPFIENKVPNLSGHIINSINILQNSLDFIKETVEQDYKEIVINNKLNILKLILLPKSRQIELLRFFIIKNNLGSFTNKWLNNLYERIINNSSKSFKFCLNKAYIYSYNNFLWVWCKNETLFNFIESGYKWNKSHINWQLNSKFGVNKKFLESNWSIRFVNKQDIISTKIGNKKVYKLLQESKVPPFLRKIWPVIVDENNICIILIGIAININYIISSNDKFLPNIELIDLYFNINGAE